jgi:hypothetical protein
MQPTYVHSVLVRHYPDIPAPQHPNRLASLRKVPTLHCVSLGMTALIGVGCCFLQLNNISKNFLVDVKLRHFSGNNGNVHLQLS